MPSNQKKSILKLVFSIIILVVVGVLLYNNFIKEEKEFSYITPPEEMSGQSIDSKFNLDFLENEVFKGLIKAEEVELPTANQLGRENPFLPF